MGYNDKCIEELLGFVRVRRWFVLINVNNLRRNDKNYNGNTSKFGVTYNGNDYIIKLSKDGFSVYSEFIASNFIRVINIPCQQVSMGIYNNNIVNVILDFTSGTSLSLHSFKDTKQSSEDTDLSVKNYTYNDVLYLIDKHLKMSDSEKIKAKEQFWDMFICDAILANRDRHWGNWGYLSNGVNYSIAPIYDNGATLFPGVSMVISDYIDSNKRRDFLYDRVYTFPASLFMMERPDRPYRTNYAEMFSDLRFNKVFAGRVKFFKEKYSINDIFLKMFRVCASSDLSNLGHWYKRFYTEIVTLRYACIVKRSDFDKVYKQVEGWLNGK